MKTLITRYPRTTGYAAIAALQLTAFFAAMLNNRLDPAHISNVLLSVIIMCCGFEIDMLKLEKKDTRREN